LKASIPFSGVGALFLVDHLEAEASGDGGIGSLGCFFEPGYGFAGFRGLLPEGPGIRRSKVNSAGKMARGDFFEIKKRV
jgi:hypothetical protein